MPSFFKTFFPRHGTRVLATVVLVLFVANALVAVDIVRASTNISSTASEHWAWNDIIGWIDFYNTGTVNVTAHQLNGYASSTAGDISLDCDTPRGGVSVCGSSNYKITNDGLGTLAGYAWNDEYGWVSFSCTNNNGCGSSAYGVAVSPTDGTFSNYAWNDIIGWISFNCADPGVCGSSNYKVKTSWTATSTSGSLDSTTYDTGVTTGVQLNAVTWQGSLPSGTQVQFQFATSNCSNGATNSPTCSTGTWSFVGSDGTTATYYTGSQNTSIALSTTAHSGYRYFRYRVTLVSNQAQTLTPRVDDVVVSWSP